MGSLDTFTISLFQVADDDGIGLTGRLDTRDRKVHYLYLTWFSIEP